MSKGFFINSVRYTGNRSILWTFVIFILFASFFERFGYYWANSSITLFFNHALKVSSTTSSVLQAISQSLAYIVPISVLSANDMYFGRVAVLPYSMAFATMGLTIVAIVTYTAAEDGEYSVVQEIFTYIPWYLLFIIFIAPMKPAFMVLAGDQFDLTKPEHEKEKSIMFSIYYWFTNVAAISAFILGPVVHDNGIPGLWGGRDAEVDDFDEAWGYMLLFMMGAISCAVSAMIITGIALSRKYYVRAPEGSLLPKFIRVSYRCAVQSKEGMAMFWCSFTIILVLLLSIPVLFISAIKKVMYSILAAILIIAVIYILIRGKDTKWLDTNDEKVTGIKTKDLRRVWSMIPFLTIAMPFWGIYNVMNNEFIFMGGQMDNFKPGLSYTGSHPFFSGKMGPAFNSFAIILVIPVLEYGLFPLMKKYGYKDTSLKRMFIGLIFASVSVFVAGGMELIRKSNNPVVIDGKDRGQNMLNPFHNLLVPAQEWFVKEDSKYSMIPFYILINQSMDVPDISLCGSLTPLTPSDDICATAWRNIAKLVDQSNDMVDLKRYGKWIHQCELAYNEFDQSKLSLVKPCDKIDISNFCKVVQKARFGGYTYNTDDNDQANCYFNKGQYIEGFNDTSNFYRLMKDYEDLIDGYEHPIPTDSTSEKNRRFVNSTDSTADGSPLPKFQPINNISYYWIILPFGLVGLAEIFFAVSCTDFFYSQVPSSYRSVMQALNMLTVALGTMMGAVVDVIFEFTRKDDLNNSSLEIPLFVKGALCFTIISAFLYNVKGYEYYVEEDTDRIEQNKETNEGHTDTQSKKSNSSSSISSDQSPENNSDSIKENKEESEGH